MAGVTVRVALEILLMRKAKRPPPPCRPRRRARSLHPDEPVFTTVRGTPTPLHESNVNRRIWQPALERAELAGLGYRFHDLRHTCVSRLVAAGADVKLVQAVAGHASPLITLKRYSHLLDSRISEAADRFDPARTP